MLEYIGIIKHVRFYSEETKFIVCTIDTEQEDKPILATGYMSYVNPQDKYRFQGEYIMVNNFKSSLMKLFWQMIKMKLFVIYQVLYLKELEKNRQLLLWKHWGKMHLAK